MEELKSKEDEQNDDNNKNDEENNEENNNNIDNLPLLSDQIISKDRSINNKENEIINEEFEEKNEEDKKENEEKLEEKEEINEEKKEEINEEKNNNENIIEEKEKNKLINEEIVKEANKEPDLSLNNKIQMTQSINKIKNKSLESKIATLLNNDENNKEEDKENNFKDKLNGIKNELSRKAEENSKNKNTFEFKYKSNEGKNNRYKNYFNNNKEDLNINSFEQININEKRYQELKDKYFLYNRCYPNNLYSSLNGKYFERYNNLFSSNCKPLINKDFKYISYNKPIVYKKNNTNIRNDKRNNDFIKLMNSCNNFSSILKKMKNNSEEKNNINDDKILYSYNKFNSYNGYNNKYNLYKTAHFDKTSKLKNIINDVLNEIKDDKNNYSLKTDLSNLQRKIRFSRSLNKYSSFERERINNKYHKSSKNKNKDFNYLLRLCSKENFKNYSQKKF